MIDLLGKDELPEWFSYPKEYLRAVEQNLIDLTPRYLIDRDCVQTRMNGLKERYPLKEYVPFALRDDKDDIACWERGKPGRVVIVHDFAGPGFEERHDHNQSWTWFRSAIEETIVWE